MTSAYLAPRSLRPRHPPPPPGCGRQLMEQVLQGVRGMRQSMSDMHRTRAQASFAGVVGPALREVSKAVNEVLETTSRRTAWLPAMLFGSCQDVHKEVGGWGPGVGVLGRGCVLTFSWPVG